MAYHERRTFIITGSVDDKTLGDHEIAERDDIREMLLMVPHPWKFAKHVKCLELAMIGTYIRYM